MKAVFIYALSCPITGKIRYVGKASKPSRRLRNHIAGAKTEKCHRANWIRSLLSQQLKPELEILAQIPESDWQQWEIDYIAAFRSMGFDLVNQANGGEGFLDGEKHPGFGKPIPESTRLKISASLKALNLKGENNPGYGKKQSPELITKRVQACAGIVRTPEWKAAISTSQKLRWKLKSNAR